MIHTLNVRTSHRAELLDITGRVQAAVSESGVQSGECIVFVPHTTAGVTINENADPTVQQDVLAHLAKLVPADGGFRHAEGNSDAHIKAGLLGFSTTVLVEGGRLVLGTWQGIYLAEFDGPRSRRVLVKVRPD
jgi:secondary thiamine-phosphate synthase enzyme